MRKVFKKRVAITGGSGLLGSSFCKKYRNNFKILKCPHRVENFNKINRWIKKNDFTYFVHFAAITNNRYKSETVRLVNVNASINLLDILQKEKKDFKFFLFISSSHVYGTSKYRVKETSKRKPVTIYGKSKKIVEDYIMKNRSKFKYKIGIARVFNFTGPKQRKGYFVPDMYEKIRRNKKITDINKFRDFIHIDDVLNSINLILRNKFSQPINISSGKKINLIKVCKILNENTFKRVLLIDKKIGKDLFGDNKKLKNLGLKKFKKISSIIKSFLNA